MKLSDKPVTIIPKNTYTKTAYSKAYSINRMAIDRMIKAKDLKTLEINGTTLILA